LRGIVVLLLVLLAATAGRAEDFRTVMDARGRMVKVHLPVQRIVVLNENVLEVLRILGAQDLVVGVSDYIAKRKQFWRELAHRPAAGRWQEPNYEVIASLRPDLLLCYEHSPGLDAEKKLEAFGIQVLRLNCYKLPTLTKEVRVLAALFGRDEKARSFIEWHGEILSHIERLTRDVQKPPKVYLEGYSEYKTWGPGSGVNDMCSAAGGENVASKLSISYPVVTPEWVVSQNPDIIIKTPSLPNAYSRDELHVLQTLRQKIMNRVGWENIRAVRQGKVYIIAADVCSGPGEVSGIAYMAKWFFPNACQDLDPEQLYREYLERFQGIPYRGHHVYP